MSGLLKRLVGPAVLAVAAACAAPASAPAGSLAMTVMDYSPQEVQDYRPVECRDACDVNLPPVPDAKRWVATGTTTVLSAAEGPLATITTLTKALTGETLTQSASGQNVGGTGGLSRTNLSVQCTAVATKAVAVGITTCYAHGADGSVHHVPRTGAKTGAADAAVGAVLDIPAQRYQVCVGSHALLTDNRYVTAPIACSG